MTYATIFYIALGIIAILGIGLAIWVCLAERWQKKLDQRSVKSIIEQPRNIIK